MKVDLDTNKYFYEVMLSIMFSNSSQNAFDKLSELQSLERKQLFFVGGAPRSGTTWIQHLIDGHPSASCMGEGLFWRQLYYPLTELVENWRKAIQEKNVTQFSHTGGYPLPNEQDRDMLLATGILGSMQRQLSTWSDRGASCQAIGEKTPEDIFLFLRLRHLFPHARLVVISRDPRDTLASAWHMFVQRHRPGEDLSGMMEQFIRDALVPMERAIRTLFSLLQKDQDVCLSITYERLHTDTAGVLATIYRFLGLSDEPDTIHASIERSSFSHLSGGRERGVEDKKSFLRQGVVGGWRNTIPENMNFIILEALGWSFPYFEWKP